MSSKINPEHLLWVPIEFLDDFEKDARIAWQSFGDQGLHSDFPYFENIRAIHKAVTTRSNPFNAETLTFDPDFKCNDEYLRFMHVDLAVKNDACGIAMCHIPEFVVTQVVTFDQKTKEKRIDRVLRPLIKFDFIGRVVAPKNGEIIFSQIRQVIYDISDLDFDIQLITYDRFQSIDSMQILRSDGYIVGHLSLDCCRNFPVIDLEKEERFRKESVGGDKYATLSPWRFYKTALNQNRIQLPYYWPLSARDAAEHGVLVTRDKDDYGNKSPNSKIMTWVEKETLQATYDEKKLRIVEPPKGSIDLLEACVGAAFNAGNNVSYTPELSAVDKKRQRTKEVYESIVDGTIFDQEDTAHLGPDPDKDQEESMYDDSTFE